VLSSLLLLLQLVVRAAARVRPEKDQAGGSAEGRLPAREDQNKGKTICMEGFTASRVLVTNSPALPPTGISTTVLELLPFTMQQEVLAQACVKGSCS
jgi:hypothetical protein